MCYQQNMSAKVFIYLVFVTLFFTWANGCLFSHHFKRIEFAEEKALLDSELYHDLQHNNLTDETNRQINEVRSKVNNRIKAEWKKMKDEELDIRRREKKQLKMKKKFDKLQERTKWKDYDRTTMHEKLMRLKGEVQKLEREEQHLVRVLQHFKKHKRDMGERYIVFKSNLADTELKCAEDEEEMEEVTKKLEGLRKKYEERTTCRRYEYETRYATCRASL